MIKNNIKLLHFVKSLEVGGIEKSTILYSNILAKKLNYVGIYAEKGFFDESRIIDPSIKRFYPKYPVYKRITFIVNLLQILRLIRTENITHIHYHHRIFILYLFFIKIFFNRIRIIYSHQNVFNDSLNKIILADKIIALTKATKDDLPKRLKKKAIIIPHGINLPSHNMNIEKIPVRFGYVGRFVAWKGIIDLITDFSILNKNNNDTQLLLFGDGDLKEDILKEITKLGLMDKVTIKNPEYELEKVYKQIDVLVLPSKTLEGFGIVLIEAMSYGIPVIVFDIPTFHGTVINNYNGIMVSNGFSKAMLQLIESKEFYSKLSRNAIQFSQKFDINKIVERYLNEIYSQDSTNFE